MVPFNDTIWNRTYAYLKELYVGLFLNNSVKVYETAV